MRKSELYTDIDIFQEKISIVIEQRLRKKERERERDREGKFERALNGNN